MCRPGRGSLRDPFAGGHTGPPLRDGGNVPEITEIGAENEHSPCGGTRGRHAGVVVPYGWLRRAAAIALGSGAERSVCASGREEMGGNRSRDHPQRGHQRRTIPQSRRSRDSSLSTREPLGTGDADCRVASLLAMTVLILCHSEEAQRADVGIRPFYDGRGFGPPRSSAPTKRRDSCRNHPSQRRTAERLRRGHEEWAGIDARTIPKGGPPPWPPRQRLAKRKAREEQLVKFGFCPMTSEYSTAHRARKSQQSPARALAGAASTE